MPKAKDSHAEKAPKKKPLKIKEALHKGELLSGVRLKGKTVALKLKPQFKQPEKYASINKAFFDLYPRSEAFRKKFEAPKRDSNMLRALILKDRHGYTNEKEILAALQAFAAPVPKRDIKKDLSTGELLQDAILEDNRVTLVMRPQYAHPDNYPLINKLFYRIHCGSPDFAAKFNVPTQCGNPPVLVLKEGHGYEDKTAILVALKEFGKTGLLPPKQAKQARTAMITSHASALLQIENQCLEALKTGFLFTLALPMPTVEHTCLVLAPNYNQPIYYELIERMLREIWQNSQELSEQIKDFKIVEGILQIRLRSQSTYPNAAAVLGDLIQKAWEKDGVIPWRTTQGVCLKEKEVIREELAPEEPVSDLSPLEAANVRLALIEDLKSGKLFSFALRWANQVDLPLAEKYKHPSFYEMIKSLICDLRTSSDELDRLIQKVELTGGALQLTLQPQHPYLQGSAVLATLINQANETYAQSERFLPEKAAMSDHSNELARTSLVPLTPDIIAEDITNPPFKDNLLSLPKEDSVMLQGDAVFKVPRPITLRYQLQNSTTSRGETSTFESASTPQLSPVTRFRG